MHGAQLHVFRFESAVGRFERPDSSPRGVIHGDGIRHAPAGHFLKESCTLVPQGLAKRLHHVRGLGDDLQTLGPLAFHASRFQQNRELRLRELDFVSQKLLFYF